MSAKPNPRYRGKAALKNGDKKEKSETKFNDDVAPNEAPVAKAKKAKAKK